MPVFHKWLQGCAPKASLNTGLWTYITWGTGDLGAQSTHVDLNPKIELFDGKLSNQTTKHDMGRVLTTKASGVELANDWKVRKLSWIDTDNYINHDGCKIGSLECNNASAWLKNTIIAGSLTVNGMVGIDGDFILGSVANPKMQFVLNSGQIKCDNLEIVNDAIVRETLGAKNLWVGSDINAPYFTVKSDGVTLAVKLTSSQNIETAANIKAQGSCTAQYFDATSDRRAKTNIKPWKGLATKIICDTPIYEFEYSDSHRPSIGVIAQEIAEQDSVFESFSLVENKKATGENGDYMTIKESKLIYILWKAVQEQQQEIEELKAQLKK